MYYVRNKNRIICHRCTPKNYDYVNIYNSESVMFTRFVFRMCNNDFTARRGGPRSYNFIQRQFRSFYFQTRKFNEDIYRFLRTAQRSFFRKEISPPPPTRKGFARVSCDFDKYSRYTRNQIIYIITMYVNEYNSAKRKTHAGEPELYNTNSIRLQ